MKKLKEIKEEQYKKVIIAFIPILLNMLLNYGICNLYKSKIYLPAMLFSFFIMYTFYTLITAFVKKTHITTYIVSIIIFLISIISNIKMYYTQSPIYLSDIYFLNNIGDVAGIVQNDIFLHIDYIQLSILIMLLILVCFISLKFTIELKNVKTRLILCLITLSIFISLLIPFSPKDMFILNTIYDKNGREDYETAITGQDYYQRYGVLSGMCSMEFESRKNAPVTYKAEEISKILEEFDNIEQENKKLQKPNIIVMFQESYWDIQNIEEVKFNKNITQNITNLKENGTSIKLLSPSYGGLSSNIEFELLTGGNLAYFVTGYHPFVQLYRKKHSENNPSIIKELKNNGYKTTVEFGTDYYSSNNIYKKLGVDKYIDASKDDQNYKREIKGTHISDKALVDDVINALHSKKKNEKIFYMVATIQTHTPFFKEKYENYDIDIVQSSLSDEETGIVLSYAQGIYDTNQQIQRLYDEVQKVDDPTIIVILGDHLPYLYNSDGLDILLQKTSYFNSSNEKQNLLRKYTTEAIIVSNYDNKIDFETEYIGPDMLLTTIINNMNITISPYYKWLYQFKNSFPAQNQYLDIDSNSNLYYSYENFQELLKQQRANIQYYEFEDSNKMR